MLSFCVSSRSKSGAPFIVAAAWIVTLAVSSLPTILWNQFGGGAPALPIVSLAAAMNAFSEEINYRASFLSTITDAVGTRHALLLTAAFFGLGHYYGVPYGVIGVVMAGLLGWLLGKSMLETRGMF